MAKQKIQLLKDDIEKIRAAQDRGFEMVKVHLAKPLEELEDLGYSRIELACAYLGLAYHILRYGRPRERVKFPCVIRALKASEFSNGFIISKS